MKFSTKDFFNGSDQIRRKHLCRVVLVSPQIWFCRSCSSGAATVHVLYGGSALLGGRLWHRCFSMAFAKFLGVSFFIGVSGVYCWFQVLIWSGLGCCPRLCRRGTGVCCSVACAVLGVWGLVGCVQSRGLGAYASHLPSFILLISFSDTLLVVSILDIVYMIAICSHFCSPEGVKKKRKIILWKKLIETTPHSFCFNIIFLYILWIILNQLQISCFFNIFSFNHCFQPH